MQMYFGLINAQCPVGRYELSNDEWLLLTHIEAEDMLIAREKAKAERGNEGE